MTLDQVPDGEARPVHNLSGEPRLRERLVELGFVPGQDVRVLRRAPLGDPLHVRVRGGAFAVRRDEARSIEVVEEGAVEDPQ